MADDEDIAALVVDNGSGMCKGKLGAKGNTTADRSSRSSWFSWQRVQQQVRYHRMLKVLG